MPESKDYPHVSYRVTGEAESPIEGKKRVLVEIAIDRTLNGYDGATMSLEVPKEIDGDALATEVLRMVNWTVEHRTGHKFPAENVHEYVPSQVEVVPFPKEPEILVPEVKTELPEAPETGVSDPVVHAEDAQAPELVASAPAVPTDPAAGS